jgi:hypothetical protein
MRLALEIRQNATAGRPKKRTPQPLQRGLSRPAQVADRGQENRPSETRCRKGAHLYAEQSSEHQIVLGQLMRRVTECVILMSALTALGQPALARSYLNCSTRKVVMISTPTGDTSSTREEAVAFVIDETTKTLTFTDNRPLTVNRLDEYWINPVSHPFGSPPLCRFNAAPRARPPLEAPAAGQLRGSGIRRWGSLGRLFAVPRRPLFGQLQCQVIKAMI